MVTQLGLAAIEHPTPYDVSLIDASSLAVKRQCRVPLKVSAYDESVLYDVLPMKLCAHPKKCSFLTTEVTFLGSIVSALGVATDLEKVRANLHDAPVLHLPDFGKVFEVTCDASGVGIVVSLVRRVAPFEFFSEKLNDAKLRYSTYDKEFYAIIQALRHWRHYLLYSEFVLFSNHEMLKYLHSQQKLSDRHARCPDFSSIIAKVRRGPSQDYQDYVITNGYLFYKNRLCVPRTLQRDFLTWEHHAGDLAATSAATRPLRQ
ncbi:uncharacterized protein LOC144716328 [Wolffia australiana]